MLGAHTSAECYPIGVYVKGRYRRHGTHGVGDFNEVLLTAAEITIPHQGLIEDNVSLLQARFSHYHCCCELLAAGTFQPLRGSESDSEIYKAALEREHCERCPPKKRSLSGCLSPQWNTAELSAACLLYLAGTHTIRRTTRRTLFTTLESLKFSGQLAGTAAASNSLHLNQGRLEKLFIEGRLSHGPATKNNTSSA